MDGIGARHFPVLLVHIVSAGAGVVSDPDAKVLDLGRVLLVNLRLSVSRTPARFMGHGTYLVQADDLAIGFLDLPQLCEEVPEP